MKQNISLVIGDVNIRMYAEHWSKGEFITHHKARTSFGLCNSVRLSMLVKAILPILCFLEVFFHGICLYCRITLHSVELHLFPPNLYLLCRALSRFNLNRPRSPSLSFPCISLCHPFVLSSRWDVVVMAT